MRKVLIVIISTFIFILLTQCSSTSGKEKKDEINWEEANQTPVSDGKRLSTNPDGERLFKQKCASCHSCGKIIAGPALKGTRKRWTDAGIIKQLFSFVRSARKFDNDKNPYIHKMKEENKMMAKMTDQDLTDEEIDAILDYCSFYDNIISCH